MRQVLVIDGRDYSRHITRKGYTWTRNDIDSEASKRTKAGTMRRDKITDKVKLPFTLVDMNQEQFSALAMSLKKPTVSVTYLGPGESYGGEFYCSSLSGVCGEVYEDDEAWDEVSFNLIEV